MQYGTLLKRAWNIIWRNKVIWVFGFLAALGSGGGGGGSNTNYRTDGREFNLPPGGQGGNLPPELQQLFTRLFSDLTLILTIVVALVCLGLLIGLVLALLSALGHGAMVEMAREADDTEKTSFSTGWNAGLRQMVRVFLIRFLLGLPTAIIILLGMIPFLLAFIPLIQNNGLRGAEAMFAGGMVLSLACFGTACCIGVLLGLVLQLIETLSIRALVLEGLGILASIGRGWNVLKGNVGEVVILWLIFLVLGIVVGIVIGIPAALLAIAVAVPMGIAAAVSPIMIAPLVMVICLIAIVSAILRSVVEAYMSTTWTLAYRQWIGRGAPVAVPVASPVLQ
jgi:hypothetical protein